MRKITVLNYFNEEKKGGHQKKPGHVHMQARQPSVKSGLTWISVVGRRMDLIPYMASSSSIILLSYDSIL